MNKRIGIYVSSRYGIENGFVDVKEATQWAERQSALLQGKFNVYTPSCLFATFENGKELGY